MDEVNALIKRIIKDNDERAFNELIKLYYNEIYGFVYKQVLDKDECLDITQEIFIKVFLGIKHYNPKKASFRTYLYSIANNYIIDMYRSKQYKQRQKLVFEEYEMKSEDLSVLEELIKDEEITRLNDAVNSLPQTHSSVIRLRFYAECSLNEISEILNMNLSNVKYYLYQGIKLLQAKLKVGDYNEDITKS